MEHSPRTPDVLVVDDFLPDPEKVRALVLAEQYVPGGDLYKASRSTAQHLDPAEVGVDFRAEFERLLGRKITKFAEHDMCGRFHYTTPRDQLVYHADGQSHAGALYLTPDAPFDAGTTFWASRSCGVRTGQGLSPAVEAQVFGEGGAHLLDPTKWRPVDVVGNVYNRLVLWRGDLVHSASAYFGTTLETGRVIQVFFFDCE